MISQRKPEAITAPRIGETIQLMVISAMDDHFTAPTPATTAPAPMMLPTIECVVETGALIQVARLIQSAAASSAAIMISMIWSVLVSASGLMMSDLMVATTLPPAITAPAISQNAAN